MNLLDALKAAPLPAAPAPVLPAPAAAGFVTFDGTRKHPTPGFAAPVLPAGKTPFGHQLAAVETALEARRVMLALQPGTGKTLIMQMLVAAVVAKGGRAVCIVPPSLRVDPWALSFAADFPALRIATLLKEDGAADPIPTDVDVLIVSDSILHHRQEELQAWAPAIVTVDESHRMKRWDTLRSIAATALCDSLQAGAIVVAASGTVVANRVPDAYGSLRLTGSDNARRVSGGSYWSHFRDRWCSTETVRTRQGRTIVKATGARDAEGLRAMLTSTCMISVPRSEILDLPQRTTVERLLEVNGEGREYRRAEREFLRWVQETRGDAAMLSAAKAEAVTKLMALWRLDGVAKAKATAEYVAALVQQGEQVVVFAHHVDVVTKLVEALHATDRGNKANPIRVATIVGGMTADEKAQVVQRFQAGLVDVLVGNITAAGVGITLTAARHVVFAQLPWGPGDFGQAQDRIYRIGQTAECTTHVLGMVDGVSAILWDVLLDKIHDADIINAGEATTVTTLESVQDEVLARYGW